MYDVAIVGAGPAGATLARLVAKKYKVLLIDKRDLDNEKNNNSIVKCCGGLIAPDAQNMIARLGLGLPKEILVDPQLFTVRTMDLTNDIERYYQRFYFNIDREKFDRWLVSLIPDNVDKRFNSIYKCFKKTDDGFQIEYTKDGKKYTEKAKILIGADGGFSKIRKSTFNDQPLPNKYISIQEWFEIEESLPYFTAIFDEEISDFYSWIIPKDKYILLGAALDTNNEPNEKFNILKEKLQSKGFKLDNKVKREGAFIYRPKSVNQVFTGKDNIAFVGEAAGAISPSSAEGFSYALRSALYLSESLADGLDGFMNRYNNKMRKLKLNILLKNLKSPAMYNPTIRKHVMKSGIGSMVIEK